MRRLLAVFACCLGFVPPTAAATLEHAGYLLGVGDEPVTRMGQPLQFRIIDAPIGGATLWSSGPCLVDVHAGRYAVSLGGAGCGGAGIPPAALPGSGPRFLEVQVGSVALTPRLTIAAVPTAENALRLGGSTVEDLDARWVRLDAPSAQTGTVRVTGTVEAAGFVGNGAGLSNVPASVLTGTLSGGQLPSTVVQSGTSPTFGTVTATTFAGNFSGNGAGLTSVPASALTGTLSGGQLPSTMVQSGTSPTFGTVTATTFAGNFSGNGAGLTNVPASALTGTLPDAVIPSNVLRSGGAGGALTVSSLVSNAGIRFGNDTSTCNATTAGTIRWTGSQFEGCNGIGWASFATPSGTQSNPGRTCKTLLAEGRSTSGLYWIDPDGNGSLASTQVYCNQTDNGGGWTLFYRNKAGVSGCSMCTTGALGTLTSPTQSSQGKLSDAFVSAVSNGTTNVDYWGLVGSKTAFMTGVLWWSNDQSGRSVRYKTAYGDAYSGFVSVDNRPMGAYPNYQWIPSYCSANCDSLYTGGYDGSWNVDVWVYVREQ